MEELIATLVLAREKAEELDESEVADTLSNRIARLRRKVKAAEKEAAEKSAKK